jgi:cell division protein FtsA
MPRRHIITGLDIGSSSIKLLSVVPSHNDSELEVLMQKKITSAGVRKGVVVDVYKTAEVVSDLIGKSEEELGEDIGAVYASVGGGHIFSTSSRGLVSVSRADQKISEEDIQRVIGAAGTFSLPSNKEIIKIFPKEFIVDGESGVKEAVGMKGVRLEADVLILGGFSPYIKNSNQVFSSVGLQPKSIIPTPLASARAVLTAQEKELGVCVLDIGAGTTSMAVFEEGNLIHSVVFPIGSGHITNDIAIILRTDINTAEKIKLEFGRCKLALSGKFGKLDKKIKIDSEEPLVFSSKMLSDIIEARVYEILDLTNKELKKISRQKFLPAGIVLTGGGADLPGIKDFAKKEIKLSCRIGLPKGFSFLPKDPSLACVCGLVLEGINSEQNPGGPPFVGAIKDKIKNVFRIFIP